MNQNISISPVDKLSFAVNEAAQKNDCYKNCVFKSEDFSALAAEQHRVLRQKIADLARAAYDPNRTCRMDNREIKARYQSLKKDLARFLLYSTP